MQGRRGRCWVSNPAYSPFWQLPQVIFLHTVCHNRLSNTTCPSPGHSLHAWSQHHQQYQKKRRSHYQIINMVRAFVIQLFVGSWLILFENLQAIFSLARHSFIPLLRSTVRHYRPWIHSVDNLFASILFILRQLPPSVCDCKQDRSLSESSQVLRRAAAQRNDSWFPKDCQRHRDPIGSSSTKFIQMPIEEWLYPTLYISTLLWLCHGLPV